ncbi:hypothetical protein ACNPM2_03685 [Stenotrophomonas geniculata]|uniref:hypothetical protein n=1 Tax=Stenotrophomonas TaxID=40323 RepID=UPI001780367D|nr:hypothetical protein [Stenotrophomonas sp. AS012628]
MSPSKLLSAIDAGNAAAVRSILKEASARDVLEAMQAVNRRIAGTDLFPIVVACQRYSEAEEDKKKSYDQICRAMIEAGVCLGQEFARRRNSHGFVSGSGQTIFMRYRNSLPPAIRQHIEADYHTSDTYFIQRRSAIA